MPQKFEVYANQMDRLDALLFCNNRLIYMHTMPKGMQLSNHSYDRPQHAKVTIEIIT